MSGKKMLCGVFFFAYSNTFNMSALIRITDIFVSACQKYEVSRC